MGPMPELQLKRLGVSSDSSGPLSFTRTAADDLLLRNVALRIQGRKDQRRNGRRRKVPAPKPCRRNVFFRSVYA